MKKKHLILIIILWITALGLASAAWYVTFADRGYAEVCFLDVGQGDACFIRSERGSSVLIDGGDKGSSVYVLEPFLRKEFVTRLDAVFISHIHDDHMLGILELIEDDFPISAIYISETADTERSAYKRLRSAAEPRNIPINALASGSTVDIDELSFIVATAGQSGGTVKDENDNSLVIRMNYGENSFLFTGDATKKTEAELIGNEVIDTDFLKVGHHGSSTSTDSAFLQGVTPELAVISVGEDNKYSHPSESTMTTLSESSTPVMRTDHSGTITIIMTPDDIRDIRGSRERSFAK